MRVHFAHSVVAVAVALSLTVPPLQAQQTPEKAAGKRLTLTTSSDAAKSALASALDELMNIGGPRRADAKLKAVVDADPQFALGRAYYASSFGALTMAERMKQFEQAIKDAASATPAELLLIAAMRESRAGRNNVARDLIDVVLKQTPDDPNVHLVRINVAANPAERLQVAQRTVERFPAFGPAHNLLGYALNTAGRKDEALVAIRKYVELVPNHPNSYDSYAEILSLQGRLDESDVQYKRALEIDPGYEAGHEGLAENAFRRGDYEGARPHIEKSLELAPLSGRRLVLLRELAALYALDHKMAEARQQLMKAIAVAEAASMPAAVETDRRNLGLLAAIEGRRAEALQHHQAGQPATPLPYMPVMDGTIYLVLGQPTAVATAKAEMAKRAPEIADAAQAQDAVHLTELYDAVAKKDVATARTHYELLKLPAYKAYGAAFLARVARQAGDKAMAEGAFADVQAFQELSLNGAFVRLIAARK